MGSHIIRRYAGGGDAYRRAVHVVAGYGLDVPDGFLQHGAVGTWILISSLLGLAADSIPVGLGLIGIAAAALAALTVTGYMAWTAEARHAPGLVAVGIGAGTLIEAAWFVWLGAELLG